MRGVINNPPPAVPGQLPEEAVADLVVVVVVVVAEVGVAEDRIHLRNAN